MFIFDEISDGLRMLLIDSLQGRRQQRGHARQGGGRPARRLLLDRGGRAFVGWEAGLCRRWAAAGAGGRIGLEQVRICQWRGGAAAGCHGWPEREVRVAIGVHVWKNKYYNINNEFDVSCKNRYSRPRRPLVQNLIYYQKAKEKNMYGHQHFNSFAILLAIPYSQKTNI